MVCLQSWIDVLAKKWTVFLTGVHVCVKLMNHRRGLETYNEVK